MGIKEMGWKAIFQDDKKKNKKIKKHQQRYGLRSFKTSLQVKQLASFESKLIILVKSIKI